MRYGSLFNHLYDSSGKRPEPEVGMPATILGWSDRHAATVVEVDRFKSGARKGQVRSVTVQQDKATRVDNNGMSESQDYVFERDPNGRRLTVFATKSGLLKGIVLGWRDEYYDFTF